MYVSNAPLLIVGQSALSYYEREALGSSQFCRNLKRELCGVSSFASVSIVSLVTVVTGRNQARSQ